MMDRHALRSEETLRHLPAMVPARFTSGRPSTRLRETGVPAGATAEDPGSVARQES